MVITLSVYLLRVLYQFPPFCSSVAGMLLRVSCILVADGGKIGLQGEDSLEVEPLVSRVRGMVSQEGAGLFIQSFGARGAAEPSEQRYAFGINQTQIPAAQHEL